MFTCLVLSLACCLVFSSSSFGGLMLSCFVPCCVKINVHDRISQLILERYMVGEEVSEVDDLDETGRGDGGFGSTGV